MKLMIALIIFLIAVAIWVDLRIGGDKK